jgi:hypothetical protein
LSFYLCICWMVQDTKHYPLLIHADIVAFFCLFLVKSTKLRKSESFFKEAWSSFKTRRIVCRLFLFQGRSSDHVIVWPMHHKFLTNDAHKHEQRAHRHGDRELIDAWRI